jgi:antitoxin HicB
MAQVQNYLRQPYARIVVPMESKGYHAEILEFPGCFAQGETVEKAYNNLEEAAQSWIETTLSQGHVIPEPSANLNYSGRIALRLPTSIHEHAAHLAERNDTSLNTFIVSAISAKVGAEELYNTLAERFENKLPITHTYNFLIIPSNVQQTSHMFEKKLIHPLEVRTTAGVQQALLPIGGR